MLENTSGSKVFGKLISDGEECYFSGYEISYEETLRFQRLFGKFGEKILK
jgi:hypothetical protein